MNRARRNLKRKVAGETLGTPVVAAEHFTQARAIVGNTRNDYKITPALRDRHSSDSSPLHGWTRRSMAYPRAWAAPCNLP
jgi:hypothetical protein